MIKSRVQVKLLTESDNLHDYFVMEPVVFDDEGLIFVFDGESLMAMFNKNLVERVEVFRKDG